MRGKNIYLPNQLTGKYAGHYMGNDAVDELVVSNLKSMGANVIDPNRECKFQFDWDVHSGSRHSEAYLEERQRLIKSSDVVLAILDGTHPVDPETSATIGYAAGVGLPVFGLRTDLRQGENIGVSINPQLWGYMTQNGGRLFEFNVSGPGVIDECMEHLEGWEPSELMERMQLTPHPEEIWVYFASQNGFSLMGQKMNEYPIEEIRKKGVNVFDPFVECGKEIDWKRLSALKLYEEKVAFWREFSEKVAPINNGLMKKSNGMVASLDGNDDGVMSEIGFFATLETSGEPDGRIYGLRNRYPLHPMIEGLIHESGGLVTGIILLGHYIRGWSKELIAAKA